MKKTIVLDYDLRDKVRITELETDGRVISIWITSKGPEYQVRYFHNGDAKDVYFLADELERLPK